MKRDLSKINPQLQQAVKYTPNYHFNRGSVWFINFLLSMAPAPKVPTDVHIENVFVQGGDERTRVRLRIYKPGSVSTPTPALLWMHGGGYMVGNPEMDDQGCVVFVRELGITVISVDYRLAPKYPFPAGLDDCYAALTWTASHARELGIDPTRLAIGGESAGGGLAAALAQLALDRREIKPVLQLLTYPMLDDRTGLRGDIDDSNNITWNHKSNRLGWESYLGQDCGSDHVPPYSVPARRKDLSGLPPAWIGVGSLDIFLEEDAVYARRLHECGIECEFISVPGAFHAFERFASEAPIVQDFLRSKLSALKKHLFTMRPAVN